MEKSWMSNYGRRSTKALDIIHRQTLCAADKKMGRGLPDVIEAMLLDTFEFDGLFVEWGDKGHKVAMVGMLKIGDVLAWKLELKQKNGPEWNMFVDSHSGDLVKMEMLSKGHVQLAIRQSDFRDVSGVRFPHQIEYLGGDGIVIAREVFDSIAIELDEQTVGH